MKLFGNKHGASHNLPEEELPLPQDKSPVREETDIQEIADEYIEMTEVAEPVPEEEPAQETPVEEHSEEIPAEKSPVEESAVETPEETPTEEPAEEVTEEAPAEELADDQQNSGESTEEAPKAETEAAEGEESSEDAEDEEDDGKPPMAFWKKMLISCGVTVVILVIAVSITVNYFLDLLNYQAADSDYFATMAASELEEETYEDSYLAALDEAEAADDMEATEEELLRWNKHIDDIISDNSTYEVPISEDVYNILLIGTDNRDVGGVGRSDVMMLVSINQKTQTIHLTSFLRDCYVSIPGYGKTRLNHSFAYGGPDKLMETLEQNFKVHVDRYVAVDFYSFMDVVDTLGGVWIYMTDEEIKVANKYIWSMNKLMDEEWSEDYIWGSEGWRKLNGKQALGHARNRFTGSDYERTARQRNIINMILYGCMNAQASTLVDLAQVILPQITTDMTKSEILNYAANIGAYTGYTIEQHQIPAEGTYSGATISGMSVISLDLDDNIEYLQNTIYAGTEFVEEETAEE